mmetsp:Transcript_3751/g.5016  ORF Transcript_3751/g.5016 Transcript_3751/m.5016 type:complete len:284 (+) Transcript_3751:212-1063(+)|eukprot:CAMPEP_0196571330 /NCGR_PEP_ID=MMETSP1081-20130531/1506_1 /TAXON_ID=36882 /ORGANISM="Pyramimonas amylifera, Strain CCMP720" /LENGTH=283 /DNA_ID=CAMNT_0041888229 /DNA_START=101 /DNA_END=952 /DNA_ORIENTATION=-
MMSETLTSLIESKQDKLRAIPITTTDANLLRYQSVSNKRRHLTLKLKNVTQSTQSIFVKYGEQDYPPIRIQTPTLIAPFGIQKWTADQGTNASLSLGVSPQDHHYPHDPACEVKKKIVTATRNKFKEFDQAIIKYAIENSEKVFGSKRDHVKIQEMYNPLVKKMDDNPEVELVKFKIPLNPITEEPDIEVYDSMGFLLEPSDISKHLIPGAKVSAVFQFSILYSMGRQLWGVAMSLQALRLSKDPPIMFFQHHDDTNPDTRISVEEIKNRGYSQFNDESSFVV